MNRSWIQLRTRSRPEYKNGVSEFIAFAVAHMQPGETEILCPCIKCNNYSLATPDVVGHHLFRHGMVKGYTNWVCHGEEEFEDVDDDDDYNDHYGTEVGVEEPNEMQEILHDIFTGTIPLEPMGEASSSRSRVNLNPNENGNQFTNLMRDAERELYPNCRKYSSLSAIVKLLHLKTINGWSNKSFEMLLEFMKDVLPDGNSIPSSHYEAKKVMKKLGLSYDKIHACINDCVLFRGEHKDKLECPKCKAPRYVVDNGKGKNVPQKVLRHFPLKPRLQRMFITEKTALDMRWHKDKRVNDGVLRHPADSEAWQDFDQKHESFANESRNVRLGLATDGFNPFGNMSTTYSMWPVFVVPYNLPPWKCMKDPFFMMSLLIPGPKAPGNDIDVYLQPLIDELNELWGDGVETYDAASKTNFHLRAAVLWTINDFPAYANLSGWSTKGKLACPKCNKDACHQYLSNNRKTVYMGHRRFLPKDHSWRRSKTFGKRETGQPPKFLSGDDVCEQLTHVNQPEFGKEPEDKSNDKKKKKKRKRSKACKNYLNWKKKSIFFELPYWKTLKQPHNIDVMHTEKNVCESVLGTLMSIEGKTKDSYNARLDMEEMGIRPELHPINVDGKTFLPPASYTLSPTEKEGVCEFLSSVKFPDGMASNISRCVSTSDCRLSGMKSHDCHVILQRLLPIALRGYLSKDVRKAIIELCLFFKELTSKSLKIDVLERLNNDIVLILCKLEKIFPPAFFDIMVHLTVHLAHEAMIAGPAQYRWMYPFERKMFILKCYVRNKARPEGSIAERYVDNECLTFCSMYFRVMETKFNRQDRNYDAGEGNQTEGISVFSWRYHLIGAAIDSELSFEDWEKIHWNILTNCDEVYPYIIKHKEELESQGVTDVKSRHEADFREWLPKRLKQLEEGEGPSSELEDLTNLACGPDKLVTRYTSCIIRGIRFNTKDRDMNRRTQNSGIVVRGEDDIFYGVIKDIIEVSYLGGNRVLLLKCDWWDLNGTRGMQTDEHKFVSVNVSKTWYKEDPFVLASQADQIFYLMDTKLGNDWRVVQLSQPRGNYDVPEKEDEDEEQSDVEEPYQQDESYAEVEPIDVDDAEVLLRRDDMEMIQVETNKRKKNDSYDAFIDDDIDTEDGVSMDEDSE